MRNVLQDDIIQQLFVAMRLDLISIVKDRLKNITTKAYHQLLTSKNAYDLFFQAIELDKYDFVKLFMDEKIDLMESNETTDRIIKLFKKSKSIIFPEHDWSVMDISDIVSDVLYAKKLMLSNRGNYSFVADPLVRRRLQPVQMLFIWALLCERFRLAELFWLASGDEGMVSALIGSAACNYLATLNITSEHRATIQKYELIFERHAVGVLEQCFLNEREHARCLLTRIHQQWGELSAIEIAVNGRSRAFVAHAIVQYELDRIWWGRIDHRQFELDRKLKYGFYASLILPLVAPKVLTYDGPKTYRHRLLCYMNAPKTIYIYNFFFFILYHLLFAYVLTMEFCTLPFAAEWGLIAWTATLIIEECRQIWVHSGTWSNRVDRWWSDLWNKMDFFGYLLFVAGTCTKFASFDGSCRYDSSDECCSLTLTRELRVAQILYSISFVILMVRIMNFYLVTKNLGPKIIMIQHMLTDFMFFILLLVILLFAYGTTAQAILYPNDPRGWTVINGIFFRPIMSIFGEMFLGEVHGYGFDGLPSSDPGVGDEYCTNVTSSSGLEAELELDDVIRCPEYHWYVQLISIIYMFASNVLLLNLLIAMFTYSFDRVQRNTSGDMDFWNSKRYELIREYHTRTPWVPPFNIFYVVYALFKGIFSRCCHSSRKVSDSQFFNRNKISSVKRPMRVRFKNRTSDLSADCELDNDLLSAVEYAGMARYIGRLPKTVDENIEEDAMGDNTSIQPGVYDLDEKLTKTTTMLSMKINNILTIVTKLEKQSAHVDHPGQLQEVKQKLTQSLKGHKEGNRELKAQTRKEKVKNKKMNLLLKHQIEDNFLERPGLSSIANFEERPHTPSVGCAPAGPPPPPPSMKPPPPPPKLARPPPPRKMGKSVSSNLKEPPPPLVKAAPSPPSVKSVPPTMSPPSKSAMIAPPLPKGPLPPPSLVNPPPLPPTLALPPPPKLLPPSPSPYKTSPPPNLPPPSKPAMTTPPLPKGPQLVAATLTDEGSLVNKVTNVLQFTKADKSAAARTKFMIGFHASCQQMKQQWIASRRPWYGGKTRTRRFQVPQNKVSHLFNYFHKVIFICVIDLMGPRVRSLCSNLFRRSHFSYKQTSSMYPRP